MSGRIGDLSPKQEEALKKFKENVKDAAKPEHDDHEFLRWLRARSFDLKKSEKMYRDNLAWRKEFGADTILEWDPPEVLKKYYPGGYVGTCKKGYPIWIDTLGPVDLKGMFYSVKPMDIYKYKVYYMEVLYQRLLPEMSKKFGRRIDQAQLIFDMDGIGMKHLWKPALDTFCGIMQLFEANYPECLHNAFIINAMEVFCGILQLMELHYPETLHLMFIVKTIDVFTTILSIFEANYPESLQTCFVINAPSIFPLLYNIAKPFLSEQTRNKIRVLGTPAIFPIAYNLAKPFLSEDTKKKIQVVGGNWKEELLKHIDADQLPRHWGGTMQGPDEYCSDKVCMAGPVPEKYYAKNQLNFVDMNNFSKVTVSKGSSLQLDYPIKEQDYVIRWQFLTEGMDIGFGLYKKTAEGKQKAAEMEEIIPTERVNSHIIPEDGSYTCTSPGTYVIRFDNTYSYLNSKKVQYLVEVLEPDTDFCTKM